MAEGWLKREELKVIERLQGSGGELQLQQRGRHFEIIYNGVFLMATYNGASERAAVRRGLESVHPTVRSGARVLMGGLGVGFSLQEALSASPPAAEVVVAEIEEAVIAWNRSVLAHVNGHAIQDPRVTVLNEPFEEVLQREALQLKGSSGGYHLIFADTDNGSSWLSREENTAIYSQSGLSLIRDCLVPGGVACFWCCRRESGLEDRLSRCFSPPQFETVLEETGQEAGFYLVTKA